MKSIFGSISEFRSVISLSLELVGKSASRKLKFILVVQVLLGVLELVALSLVALLGSVAVNGITSGEKNERVDSFFVFFKLNFETFQSQVAALGILAATLMIIRTLTTMYFSRKILFFLSNQSAMISTDLTRKLLSTHILTIREISTQESLYALTDGVTRIAIGILATTSGIIVDISLLIIISVTLFVVDPTIALSTVFLFLGIAYSLYKFLHAKASNLGRKFAHLTVESNNRILEALSIYRELVIRKRRNYYVNRFEQSRLKYTRVEGEISFLPLTSKYVIEISLVIGGLLICALQFIFKDANEAISSLIVFLAAGTRIAPAVLRIQQGALLVNTSISASAGTYNLVRKLEKVPNTAHESAKLNTDYFGFRSNVRFNQVRLRYPNSSSFAIDGINLEFQSGKFIALVGPSGAGKTTIVDCLLGIIEPTSGEVLISGVSPLKSIDKWPGAIGYVPQDIAIIDGTIMQNVGVGYSDEEIDEKLVMQAVGVAALTDFVNSLPNGVHTNVGELGAKLSGGQRQRLGIARAMYTKPRLLVLDEATSALDGQTEFEIAKAIQSLGGEVTVVMIAHRLSTIKDADQVVYMSEGNVVCVGTFDEVRQSVPEFDNQAKLMGL